MGVGLAYFQCKFYLCYGLKLIYSIMEMKVCQSCGMPMIASEQFGTNADDSRNLDYCCFCYEKGQFVQDFSMEEMIEHCAQFVDEFNKELERPLTREQAIVGMQKNFPSLKRWQAR